LSQKIEAVQAMESAAFAGNWDLFKSFLTDDVCYRVANTAEVTGPEAVVDFLLKSMSTDLAIQELQIRAAWETEDTVIFELNMKGLRLRDNKDVAYPCVDIYRFANGKIRDWRVFPIECSYVS
jgi:ketosteroid isomerase-like protein